jgi:diadenosine tetraphosphate (Ap4A) HIT family hydrolase
MMLIGKTGDTKVKCIGCALEKGDLGSDCEKIFETKNFVVSQDYETPIPGFMIVSSKKHIKGIEELNENERKEFIDLLFNVRRAISSLGIKNVYIIQKEDSIEYVSHFHAWLFPRYPWMMEKFGRKISGVSKIIEYARKNMTSEKHLLELKDASEKIKANLMKN